VSLRDNNGSNAFAVKPEELQGGREGAPYDELKYISQTAEYFLAGVLDGLTDGKFPYLIKQRDAKAILVMPTVSNIFLEVVSWGSWALSACTHHQ
jgi:hypothetical protein